MFKLKAEPTFTAKVEFPIAGGESVEVALTFKHRTKAELNKWLEGRADRKDVETFLDMVVGWEIEEPFNKKNVEMLLDQRIGVALATYQVYLNELTRHREKNS